MAKQTAREAPKAIYQSPEIEIVVFPDTGVLTMSNVQDENEGEWDPLIANDALSRFINE